MLEVPSFPTDVSSGYGFVRFALGPASEPRLLVPVAPNARLPMNGDAGRLTVKLSRFSVGGRKTSFVDLMSTDRALDSVFAELAIAVLNRIGSGISPVDAIEGTVSEFRELLWESDQEQLPSPTIYGLIGELIVLRDLVGLDPSAVQSWIGPYEERHDFRRGTNALEAKATSRVDSSVVMISSVEQLTEPTGGTLSLIHVGIERADGGDISVGTLYDDLVAAGIDRKVLQNGLNEIKCFDPKSSEWNRLRFNLESVTAYRVEEGFPRISSRLFPGGALPNGVSRVEYSVDLHSAAAFLLSRAELTLVLKRFLQ